MKKIIGWVLWSLGLAFMFVASNNAEENIKLSFELHQRLAARWMENIPANSSPVIKKFYQESNAETQKYSVKLLQEDLASHRRAGYFFIGGLMGVGTILILTRGRKEEVN